VPAPPEEKDSDDKKEKKRKKDEKKEKKHTHRRRKSHPGDIKSASLFLPPYPSFDLVQYYRTGLLADNSRSEDSESEKTGEGLGDSSSDSRPHIPVSRAGESLDSPNRRPGGKEKAANVLALAHRSCSCSCACASVSVSESASAFIPVYVLVFCAWTYGWLRHCNWTYICPVALSACLCLRIWKRI
jgi:hypothetical protein